jgi:hypothetical protein
MKWPHPLAVAFVGGFAIVYLLPALLGVKPLMLLLWVFVLACILYGEKYWNR